MTATPESELVEHVARAMQNEVAKGRFSLPTHQALELARGAIAAMREPTMAMSAEGTAAILASHPRQSISPARQTAEQVWRDMIDQALR